MALNAPVILEPTSSEGFSTNLDSLTLAGTTDFGTSSDITPWYKPLPYLESLNLSFEDFKDLPKLYK